MDHAAGRRLYLLGVPTGFGLFQRQVGMRVTRVAEVLKVVVAGGNLATERRIILARLKHVPRGYGITKRCASIAPDPVHEVPVA